MKHLKTEQRRAFLKKMALGIGSTSLLATQTNLQLMKAAVAADYNNINDHKSLVCVFLQGGNDSFNMFVPYQQSAYNAYSSARTSLAIPRNKLLALKGNQHAFHPSMPKLRSLYNSDKLGVVRNVGALIRPTSRNAFQNGTAELPAELFSHNHQQEFWQTGKTAKASVHAPGWGGKMMDLLSSANTNSNEPAMFSVAGNSLWQKGVKPLDFVLNTNQGVEEISAFKNHSWPYWKTSRVDAWDQILQLNHDASLKQHMSSTYIKTQQRISALISQIAQAQTINTPYPSNNRLAKQLKMVAKMISIRENLGMKRQIFFVAINGWDSHGNQLKDHKNNLILVDDALDSFYKTTVEFGLEDSVTTFTASEFGRSYSINGDGTDHAWAGHNLVLGGAVNGGLVHGDDIDLSVNGQHDAGDTGRFIPSHGVDQYGATLAKWMGMTNSDILDVFPNLHNFNNRDMGFMI